MTTIPDKAVSEMARTDQIKKLFASYIKRDDLAFRTVADEIILEERRKQHVLAANELERTLKNGNGFQSGESTSYGYYGLSPLPQDSDRKTNLLEIRQPSRILDDLVLTDNMQCMIERVLREFRDWDVLQSNGLTPSNRVLFCGPSGCGKTATAEAMAMELGLPLIYVRFDAVVSSLLGETAANLRKVFDYARRGRWVMLFDEFDAIGRSRDDATEHGEIKRVVNSFLQIMDGFNGQCLIIAATNFEQALDPAIWRRFDEIVRFERPRQDQLRLVIVKRLLALRYKENHLKMLTDALNGATFADAERVCLDIRKTCVMNLAQEISTKLVDDAIARQKNRVMVLDKAISHENPSVDQD